ncbi:MAG: T9SS type A sorting domain-containing protein [Saprospiraceae bacterium]|nr:T9SS type A sorting domain-containing protein [Saprospiraceae bacterium]
MINANNSTQYGIENNTGSTFNNSATINIGSTSAVGTHGLVQRGAFSNNTGGLIKIDRSSEIALWSANGTFTNAATITIGSLAGVGAQCIRNHITFNNNAGGVINANNSTQYGIENVYGSTFNNSATINIGSTSTVGTDGLFNEGDVNNNTGGQINIDRSTSAGFRNNNGVYAPGTITNAATINIGSMAAVGMYGLYNQGPFNNNTGGQIKIDRATGTGLVNSWGSFTNAATITIGNNAASAMQHGIENYGATGAFNNNAGGQIKIDRCSSVGISNTAGTFTNNATVKIGEITAIPTLVNGSFTNSTGGILKGTGSIVAASFTNAGGTLSPGYSPGKMTFTASEDFSNNTLFMEVNGTGTAGVNFDQVVVNGTATLGGTLNLSVNFTPNGGDYVVLLTASQVSGTFSTVTGVPANCNIVYSSTEVRLMVPETICGSIGTLTCGTAATQTLSGSGEWNVTTCGYNTPGKEKVYSFTPTTTGEYALQVTSATGTGWIDYMYKTASGGCASDGWTCIGHTNSSTTFPTVTLTAGTEYYLLLDGENIASSTQTFQINCPVVLTCPTNTTTTACQTQAAVNTAFATWLATASGMGGCNGVLTNNNVAQGGAPPACGGSRTVTFTYTSTCAPLTTTCQATFTVTAPPNVVLTCPTNTTITACQTQAAVNTAFATWLATASGTGGCNGVLTNNNVAQGGAPPACGGSRTVTFTYTSTCAPLTTTCQATFTVTAPPNLVLTCPTNATQVAGQTQVAINAAFNTWLATVSASGGCNGILTNNNTGAPPATGGTTTVTFTYTSSCAPLTTTCQATFTVAVAEPIVLTCPTNTTTNACQAQAAVNTAFAAWLATASGTGGCNGVLTNNNTGAPPACGGSTTVTFTYTSSCLAPTTTCQATFTVPPAPTVVLTCPQNTTTAACQTQAAVNTAFVTWLATASASGGCNGVLTNNNTGAPNACGGSTTVTFTYTSTCAPLTTTCQATFTVTAPPTVVLTCPVNTTTASCQAQAAVNTAFAAWLATVSASGGCNGVLTNNNTGAPLACGGSTTVTFTYTNGCTPTPTTCEATFTVATPPNVVLTCMQNTTTAACQTQAVVNTAFSEWLATASASGGCNSVLTNNNTGAPSACGGSTTVTFTYTSSCAPTITTCQATFTVAAPPTVTLTCPVNTTTAACQTQDAINAQFAAWLATASGSGGCGGALTNNSVNQGGAPSACGGSRTVTFTYASDCASTTTCQATFTVAAPPTVVLTCPANMAVSACLTQAALDAQYNAWLATASAAGGCGGTLTNNSPGAPSICSATAVTRTVVFTYTSGCAPLTTTCTATFTVPAYPNFTLPANGAATVACPALATQPTPPTVVDACGKTLTPTGPTITNAPNPVSCEGTRTYAWTYTDCSGHVNTWSYVYTIEREPFTVPANGASQVACPSLITSPTPPTVFSNCGEVLTPTGPIIGNNPNPITCEGTRTFTFTYTDCEGNTAQWSHVTTVERQPFAIATPNGNATVACPDQTDATPTPPIVTSNCGEVLIQVISVSAKPGCEGDRAYIFHYTDCEGNTADWQFTYHVVYQNFMVPANEVVTVNCPLQAVQPLPPTILDNCGKPVNMSGPVVSHTQNANSCEASRKYEWTFQDCAGHLRTWSKTFHFEYDADFYVNPDQTDYVSCLSYAQPPIPPTIYDFCGNEIVVTGPVVEEFIENGCAGWRKFTFTYTDCGGNSHPWVFTTFANDDQPPLGNCVSGTVDVTNLSCIEEVPCPDDFDFGGKVAEMIAAGNIHDECSGNDLVVELDSWSSLWQCTDLDGDGVNTFGRTFYFRIADQCGNEMPSLCSVTYSGVCLPIETFPQDAWGVMGGEPGTGALGNATTDLQVITGLLGQGPLFIGGSHRSISLTNAQCVMDLLPSNGYPNILANCQQVNCGGCNPAGANGIKNKLAANTIALTLNLRYNVQYNGLTMNALRAQGLNCIEIDADITACKENGGCKLLIWETNGTPHEFPYTIGGLLDLANLYLDGNLALAVGNSLVIAAGLNLSIENVNTYWHQGSFVASCDTGAGIAQPIIVQGEKALPRQNGSLAEMRLVPNPANREVRIELAKLAEKQEVVVVFYNLYGQAVLHRELGKVASVSERIMLDGLGTGVYFVRVKAGDEYYQQKLFITKD